LYLAVGLTALFRRPPRSVARLRIRIVRCVALRPVADSVWSVQKKGVLHVQCSCDGTFRGRLTKFGRSGASVAHLGLPQHHTGAKLVRGPAL
jgi:hypothetical protein